MTLTFFLIFFLGDHILSSRHKLTKLSAVLYKVRASFMYSDLHSIRLDIPGDIGSALAVYGHMYVQDKSYSERFLESEQKEPYSKVQF